MRHIYMQHRRFSGDIQRTLNTKSELHAAVIRAREPGDS